MQNTQKIPGLIYHPDYITEQQATHLTTTIDAALWLTELKRRVQHYGYKYDYKARAISKEMHLGPLPDWAQSLADTLHKNKHTNEIPDQLIINEYEPGQGIAAHIDCEPCFDNTIGNHQPWFNICDGLHKQTYKRKNLPTPRPAKPAHPERRSPL